MKLIIRKLLSMSIVAFELIRISLLQMCFSQNMLSDSYLMIKKERALFKHIYIYILIIKIKKKY